MKKTLLLYAIASVLFTDCSDSKLFEKEKMYTPLYVYYNPLPSTFSIEQDGFPESYYPDFVNYPNDRVKHGLRNNVSLVRYSLSDNNGGAEYIFDAEGKLKQASTFWDKAHKYIEQREFRYDDMGRLIGVYRNSHENQWAESRQKFEYDAMGRLVKREGGMSWAHQVYSYYEDGTLKEITPQYFNDYYSDTKGKMEFDSSGNLVKMEAHMTSNPFMSAASGSICTYAYTDGLCTEKVEKIILKKDTIVCRNLFSYNDKGDLTRWEYSGGIYQTNLKDRNYNVFFNAGLKITFEYEYDDHDNWTIMRVVLPEDYEQFECLIRCYGSYLLFVEGRKRPEPNEKPIMTFRRHIEYQAFSTEEEREQKKKDAPKFTAVQGRGLYGNVKSVSDGEYTVNFDEYGNIIGETWSSGGKNIYDYESPLRYVFRSETGPFIGPFRITCEENIRKEEDEKGIEGTTEYEFDNRGRVIRYRHFSGMMPVE